MLPPRWFAPSVWPGLPSYVPLASPLNVSSLFCKVGIVSVLALNTRGTAVAGTDIVTVCLEVAFGVPGWFCGFLVVGVTAAPSSAASPCGEVGDDVKEAGNIGVARREGGREGCVGYDKSLKVVVLLDGVVWYVLKLHYHRVSHFHLLCIVFHSIVGNTCEPDKLPFFEKGSAPHRFPSYPGFLVVGKPHPNTPCIIHATG